MSAADDVSAAVDGISADGGVQVGIVGRNPTHRCRPMAVSRDRLHVDAFRSFVGIPQCRDAIPRHHHQLCGSNSYALAESDCSVKSEAMASICAALYAFRRFLPSPKYLARSFFPVLA